MTIRQIGSTGIKLVGAYLAATGLVSVARLLASFAMPRMAGFPSAGDVFVANALSVAGTLCVAAACLFGADLLAGKLFEDERVGLNGLSRRDMLQVGLTLVGISTALAGLPMLVQIAGRALWYTEGSRQWMFGATMERSWEPAVNSVITILLGSALAANARRLASALDAR